jgi:transposase-like protein
MTLNKIYKIFPNERNCVMILEEIKWPNGVVCPYCSSGNYTELKGEVRYHCNTCNTSFSVTVGTIFHKTKCDLQKWFFAIYLLWYAKKQITIREMANQLNVAKQTAHLITNKIKNSQKENQSLLDFITDKLKEHER